MSSTSLISRYQETVETKQSPNDDTRDQARMLWHDLRWSDLITPAPSAISIFGQLTLVGVTTDFNLEKPDGPDGRKFSHILNPSFRATVAQLRTSGVRAFGKSRTNMDELRKHCSVLQETVNEIMDLLFEKDMDSMSTEERQNEIISSLPSSLEFLRKHTNACSAVVDDTVIHFTKLLDLAMEMNVQTTATKNTADKKAKDIELQKTILNIRISGETEKKQRQDKYVKEMQKYAQNAEKRFDTAVNNTPTSGQLLGMQVAQKATDLACMGANVLIQKQLTGKQVMTSLANDAVSKALSKGLDDKPDPKPQEDPKKLLQAKTDEMDDPIFINADRIRDTVITLINVLTCARGQKPDWDDVMQKDPAKKSGLTFVKKELVELAEAKYGSSHLAKDGKLIIDKATKLANEIKEYNDDRMAGRVNEIISEAKELNTKADRLSASVSLKSGQAPVQNPMQVNPPELPKVGDDNASVINLAVQNSQFQVSVTAQQMENSQLLYQKAHEDMQAIAEQLNKFTAEIKKLNEEEVDWDRVRSILVKTVDLLAQLVIQLEHLREFFAIIANSVDVILATAFEKFRGTAQRTINNTAIGGITLNEHSRTTLLKHAVNASKIEYVMARVAKVYIKLYDDHIMPGMTQLGHLPAFTDDKDEETKSRMLQQCADLKEWAANTADGMRDVLDEELASFEKEMKARETEFKNNFKPFITNVDPQMTKAIAEAKEQHVAEVTQVTQAVARRRPAPPRMTDD